ncbi:thiazolylpeptide-type bacteriocin [Streptomyces tateyamensis]|uniref:Thiazolylpeptide-type bacteriocin n=1 Tax=Streptomyces tateyamensis TaxID=565073 RepID=A0A2V4NSN8_9ACTN|nr:thiazolylpeptide-type bacteriocin [Streptomyces tateyamensis]PYC79469.1 thiazolylpeptide-type bacteriocin [Streptomyces tateyamensis]
MSDTADRPHFELEDLDLSDLTVSSLRDSAALPEGGASWGSSSCQGSSSCAVQQHLLPA